MNMKTKLWIGIPCAVALFLGFGILIGANDDSATTLIGAQFVYDEIDTITNCNALQTKFDIAMDNVEHKQPGNKFREISLSYAKYIDKRLEKLGCY